jgi:hypothetical protein
MDREDRGLRIERDLAEVPLGEGCALLIRHADRDGALDRVVGDQQGINELGAKRSVAFGRYLRRFGDIGFYSSPVGRCVDTCALIAAGFGKEATIEQTEFLGMRAPFMVDPEAAYRLMGSMGLNPFIEAYVKDELDPRVVMPCAAGTRLFFRYALERMRDRPGGVSIFCTHDIILTPTMVRYFGFDFKAKGLVPFLDGIVLQQHGLGYRALYEGRSLRVAEDGVVATLQASENA